VNISMVPADDARAYVQDLVSRGMSQSAIRRAAGTSSSVISSLLNGQFNAERTPVRAIQADTAARLLAVEFVPSPPKPEKPDLCDPGTRFQRVGYRVGQCDDCGQLAPLNRLTAAQGYGEVLIKHPRVDEPPLQDELPPPVQLPEPRSPDCGTTRGAQQHRRDKTELCGPCRYTTRGYDAGYKAAMTRAAREARDAIPRPLAEAVVKACRAYVLRRPVPQFLQAASAVVRIAADAEFEADSKAAA